MRSRSPPLFALPALLALALAASPLAALPAERSLHWKRLDVEARLDSAGDLHVVERQVMVFTGAWNGGERVFRVDPGQRLRLERVLRVDGGVARPLAQGSLDLVDHFAWAGARTLRWRSRAPSDPPFRATELTYVLEYTLSGVLVDAGGGGYRLAHDFAFTERSGPILEVRAHLALDPAWEAALPPGDLLLERRDLAPGEGAVQVVPLRWVGHGPPPAAAPLLRAAAEPGRALAAANPLVGPPLPAPLRVALLVAVALALSLAVAWVVRHGRARGLFEPLPDVSAVDEAWLESHVLAHRPEVVGAAWDDKVAAPEVSAVLARMAAEGKLATRVERVFLGLSRNLHLELLVNRGTLEGYERRLVDGLFFDGDRIDTARLRKRYRKTGFDPASRIRPVREHARALAPAGPRRSAWPWGAAAGLLGVAALLGWLAVARGRDPAELALPAIAGMLLLLLAGFAGAGLATAVTAHARRAVAPVVLLALWGCGIAWVARGGEGAVWAVLAQAALWSAGLLLVAGLARTRLHPGTIALRKSLTTARRYFARELRRPEPRLRDGWIPYLLALGLGGGLDRWVRLHGDVAASRAATASGSGMAGARWSGGGGAFSGGGASGSWAALGSLSSVPAPSSSSGSGSSGGSSSGGGGGGGW